MRWYSTPLMDKYTAVDEDECCYQFPQLRILEYQRTSVATVPANFLEGLTHLQSVYMDQQELTELPANFARDLDSIYYFDVSHNDILKVEEGGIPTNLKHVLVYNMNGNPTRCFQGVDLTSGAVSQTDVSCSCGAGYYANGKDYCVEATCPTSITFPTFANNFNDGVSYGDCSGDSSGGNDVIKDSSLKRGTTCTVTCANPYEGSLDYVCADDGQWKSKSGRVLECIKVHDYRTVYGPPGTELVFKVPLTVKTLDQLLWDPAKQWAIENVVDHFGKAHAQEVDLLATMDIVLKCIDFPSVEKDTIKLDKAKFEASVEFKWKEFGDTGTFLFDGLKKTPEKTALEDRCDYDFSAMVRAEDGFITAGGAGLTRGVVRVFTDPTCITSDPEAACVFYDQKLVFQRSLLQRPTILFPIQDIEGATGGCLGRDFKDSETAYGNEEIGGKEATCDGNAEDDFRRQGYTQGQEVEMNSTIAFVNTASPTYGSYRLLEVYNGIEARVAFVAGETMFDDDGNLAEGGLPKGLYLDKDTGQIGGTLGEHGDLDIKVTALAIDDSCPDTPKKCQQNAAEGKGQWEEIVVADFTFEAAAVLREQGQVGITATVGNRFEGGLPEMEGGRRDAADNLKFSVIERDGYELPAGLEVDPKTGQVVGTPLTATKKDGKPFEVTVGILATDDNGYSIEIGTLGITVRAAITATWGNPLPEIVINRQIPEYDATTVEPLVKPLYRYFAVRRKANATHPMEYLTTDGSNSTSNNNVARLPYGIKFNGGRGDFYSEPTEAGEFELRVEVTDAEGSTAILGNPDPEEFITLIVHECTRDYNCNGQGECEHGANLYDGVFTCVCNNDYKDEVGAGITTFCGQKIDKASRALGIVIALAFVFGIAGIAGYKYRIYMISMRAFDFESELQRMLDSGEMDADGVGNAGFPREIKRANVVLIEMIGEGQFGEVFKGELDESASGGVPGYAVAVKTSKEAEGEGAEEMVREAAVMAQLSGHKNLVSLIGVVTSGVPLLLVISICENGSLLSFVKERTLGGDPMSDPEKLGYCQDVAVGMAYLAKKRFVHRDLAARNILVDSNKNAKVADFGLTRAAGGGDTGGANGEAKDDYYKSQRGVFPVRWTAPEAMETLRFTIATDVWAWAITVTEIFANGLRPYDGMNNATVITQVMAGYRHPKPEGCPGPVYQIMLRCWAREPQERPSFSQVEEDLGALFDRETLSFASGVDLTGVMAEDNYNIGGDGAVVEESSYSIGGDAAAPVSAPAAFLAEESSYGIGGDAAMNTGGNDSNAYTDMNGKTVAGEAKAKTVAVVDPFAPIAPRPMPVVSLTATMMRGAGVSSSDTAGLLDNVDEESLYEI